MFSSETECVPLIFQELNLGKEKVSLMQIWTQTGNSCPFVCALLLALLFCASLLTKIAMLITVKSTTARDRVQGCRAQSKECGTSG